MTNPLRGEASLVAGEATYTLKLDVNALVEAEDLLGMAVGPMVEHLSGNAPRLGIVRGLVWAALQASHSGTTLQQAGAIIQAAGLIPTTEAIQDAINRAFPEPEPKPDPQ